MSEMLVTLLICVYSAILRKTDSRTKRYVIANNNAMFGRDLCDFIATMENIRANFKIGTIQGSGGEVFNIGDYLIPQGFLAYLRLGEVYFNEASKEKGETIFKAVWNPRKYVEIVRAFFRGGYSLPGLYKETKRKTDDGKEEIEREFSYYPEIMSPSRMRHFYEDLKFEINGKTDPITASTLQEMNTVSDDQGRQFLIGGSISSECSYLSGVTIPTSITPYLREVPSPTTEEVVSWIAVELF